MSECERAATCAARAELKLSASEPWISVSLSITETAGTLGFRKQSRPFWDCPSSTTPSYWCSSDAPPPPLVHTELPPSSLPSASKPQLNSVTGSLDRSDLTLPSFPSPSFPAELSERWFPSSLLVSTGPREAGASDGFGARSELSLRAEGATAAARKRKTYHLQFDL